MNNSNKLSLVVFPLFILLYILPSFPFKKLIAILLGFVTLGGLLYAGY